MGRKSVDRIVMKCTCGKETSKRISEFNKLKNKDEYRCNNCNRIRNQKTFNNITFQDRSDRMKKNHANNPEMASIVGKKRRAKVNISGAELRRRQQIAIESDPEKYSNYCAKRKDIAIKFHAGLTDKEKEKHYSKVFKNGPTSKAEDEFFNELLKYGLNFERNICISGFFPDGVDEDRKIIIEFYGDSFHCNPIKFQNPNQHCSWLKRTVQDQWDRDKMRIAVFSKCGYKVIIVWENDWRHSQSVQIERIKNILYS
jgi:G:T-mismatch repair DNA endonuclease (very short patch repair protein)